MLNFLVLIVLTAEVLEVIQPSLHLVQLLDLVYQKEEMNSSDTTMPRLRSRLWQ